jgi:hypothetical protein
MEREPRIAHEGCLFQRLQRALAGAQAEMNAGEDRLLTSFPRPRAAGIPGKEVSFPRSRSFCNNKI